MDVSPAPAGRDDDAARILSTGCAALHPWPRTCAPVGHDIKCPGVFVTHPDDQAPRAARLSLPNAGSAKLQLCTGSNAGAPISIRQMVGAAQPTLCATLGGGYFESLRMMFLKRVALIGWSATTLPSWMMLKTP
jgi:hypothetical protein